MRNLLEKHFQCERYHKHACQKNEEHANQTCKKNTLKSESHSLCDRGVRLENHFLFLVMCHEQLESMSHVSSKPPSITYTGREKDDDSVLGLVR
jgi:hypothetical protein